MLNREDFIKQFATKCKEDNAALFLGAGMSVDAGLPSWKSLFEPLAKDLGIDIENTKFQIYDISQFYANTYGESELYKRIGKEINRILISSKAINELCHMQLNSIWTTNFDQVLETNFERIGKITNVISKESDLICNDLNKNINIFKMNGDIRDISNAVITKSDLEKYEELHDYFLAFFKRELITKTFLFLGYSFSDSLVLPCISELDRAFVGNQPHHYTILKKSDSKDFIRFLEDLEKRYKIEVLLIDDYSEISTIIQEINFYTNQKNVFISGSYEGNDSEKLYEIDNLCKSLTNILYKNEFTIINGYGFKVGYYIASQATKLMIEENVVDLKKHLLMYPFDEHLSNSEKTKHREYMISKANISIFMYGSGNINGGMLEEFNISKQDKNRIIIPIGSTGGSAKIILNEIKKNILMYPYLEKYIDSLDTETNPETISKIVLEIIKENLKYGLQ